MADQPQVVYLPPDDKTIQQYAFAVCRELGQTGNPVFERTDVKYGLAQFIRSVARAQAKYMTLCAQNGQTFDKHD